MCAHLYNRSKMVVCVAWYHTTYMLVQWSQQQKVKFQKFLKQISGKFLDICRCQETQHIEK